MIDQRAERGHIKIIKALKKCNLPNIIKDDLVNFLEMIREQARRQELVDQIKIVEKPKAILPINSEVDYSTAEILLTKPE